jgi:DNA polymerase (family 10)
MDIASDALAELDIVIGSVHSYMGLEPEAMTDRLLRALECPHLTAMGHPTGRLLLHRDPFTFDFDKVISEAVRRGVWMEVNSSPERLDLNAHHIRAAKAKGAKFIVSTDAHHPKHLLNMRYGILTARRGGLEPEDILNTYPAERFTKALRRGD